MRLADIHCHLNFPEFDRDRDEVIKRALNKEIWMINVGTDLETSKKSIELAEKYEGVWATVGLHPTDRAGEDFDLARYRGLLARHPKVVAIGECGLDLFRIKNNALPAGRQELRIKQKDIFRKQIELAIELNKPLMIHCRDAYEDVFNILKSYFLNHKSDLRANMHFFSGDWKQAEKFLELGFSLSFAGPITFSHDYDEVIKNMPLEKIMAETDSPFAAPALYRGKRNEPFYVREVIKRIAEIKNVSCEEAAKITTQNAINFFGL